MKKTKEAKPQTEATVAPPVFDRTKATPIDPARRHEPTGKTIAWEQDGHTYTATGMPVAPSDQQSKI